MKKPKKKKQKPISDVAGGVSSARPAASAGAITFEPAVTLPEEAEPIASKASLPVLLVALLGLLVYAADTYIIKNGGQFNAMVYSPHKSVPKGASTGPDGAQIFNLNCAACHAPNGAGNAGLNVPPLAGSEWVLEAGPNRVIRIVLNGLTGPIEVKGQVYNNQMLPWRDTMSNEQIAAVLTYIRQSWGNKAGAVTNDVVAKIREETAARSSQWTAEELKAVPPN